MEDAAPEITTGKAFLYHVLKRLGLDLPVGTRSAQDRHIVLLNREVVDRGYDTSAIAIAQQRRAG